MSVFLVTVSVAGPSQPFGPNPKLGQTYGGYARDYLHAAIDIQVECNDSIFTINEGIINLYMTGNERAGKFDTELWVGDYVYGHIDRNTIPVTVVQKLINNDPIETGTFIGLPSCSQRSAKPGWDPHIHFFVGNTTVAYDNPWEILRAKGLTCDYIKEVITNVKHGAFFESYANNGSHHYKAELDAVIISGSLKLIAFAGFETHLGASTPITPREISWGIDGNVLGSFSFSGQLPRENILENTTRASEVMFKGSPYIIDYTGISGSLGNGVENDLSSISKGHWNTLQSSDSSTSWFIPVDPCSTDLRKFKDGPHKVFVNFTSYCDSIQSDTIDVIIDNNPPQAEVEKIGDYAIKVTFTEPMDPSSFTDNIDIGAICRNMAPVNIDSMKFSEDLTELTMFLPDTFPGNEAYHVELSNEITDIAGTPLDGNANCVIDDYDNYDTIVGTGYCNHTFIVQTGGYSTLEETYNYTDHWNSPALPPRQRQQLHRERQT
jgi:hypothetical protein